MIGVAVFGEAPQWQREAPRLGMFPPMAPAAASESARSADSAVLKNSGSRQRQQLGTGHGQREWSTSSTTTFERASRTPKQITELRYDTRPRLVALGIIPDRATRTPPQAFPGVFVADPPPRGR